MSKLYVGKLSRDVSEDDLRKLFEEHDIQPGDITLKKNGFAFVDLSDDSLVEKAIEKLNGYQLKDGPIKVEASVPKKATKLKIIIKKVPTKVEKSELEKLATTFGTVTEFEPLPDNKAGTAYAAFVTYEQPEQAEQAKRQLDGFEYQGSKLGVNYEGQFNNRRFNRNNGGPRGRFNQRQEMDISNFPVRILVPSDAVGAIIGKEGKIIKGITKETNCKVDIHRKDNIGSTEKVQAVTICGEPSQITETIRQIMAVLIEDSKSKDSHTDIPLKILAHNALVGRLIGKSGSSINAIMEESKAKVTVSLIQDLTVFNPERTVTIYGTLDQCIEAESLISKKLRKSYESYIQNLQPQQHDLFPGLNHMNLMSGMHHHGPQGYGPHGGPPGPYGPGGGYDNYGYHNQGPMNGPYGPQGAMTEPNETTFLYVPKDAVGALIGVGGKNIRETARASNATIRVSDIAPAGKEDSNERVVKIVGGPEAQWKAQFYIYDRIRNERIHGNEEIHLTSEISVPSEMIGRIIGKGGSRVRELQRVSGAKIEVPRKRKDGAGDEGDSPPPPNTNQNGNAKGDEVVVKMFGHFYANQAAQRQIRKALSMYFYRQNFQGRPMRGERGPRRWYRGGPNQQ